jgi:hypothetical protein
MDSCQLEGGGGNRATFSLYRPNVFTLRTLCPFVNVDDWSACILHEMGEVISIDPSSSGIQITYMVKSAPESVYVFIQYRGISIFPVPVKIDQVTVFKNSGRLAFRAIMSDVDVDSDSYFNVMDMSPNGSAVALYNYHCTTRIYEIVVDGEMKGNIVYRLSACITKIRARQQFSGTRTIVGFTDKNKLAEVSFDDVILRTFPFSNIYSFDICQASDSLIVSFSDRTDIVLVKLSTGETLRTVPFGEAHVMVNIFPPGQFINAWKNNFVRIYSSITGDLIKEMQCGRNEYITQFMCDDIILVRNQRIRSVKNIFTGETCEFLPGCHVDRNKPFVVKGSYAYFFANDKLCAYE